MTPPAIVEAAIRGELAMIAICDHNAVGNVAAVQEASVSKLCVVAGMEITTAEDVHVLGLFPDVDAAACVSQDVQATLPELSEHARDSAMQRLMDAEGSVVGTESRMLSASSTLTLEATLGLIKGHHGLAIAAHADKPFFSVLSQLGVFPTEAGFDAIEVSAAGWRTGKAEQFDGLGLPTIASSDSHFLAEIGTCGTLLELLELSFAGLSSGLNRIVERRISRA